MKRNSVASVLVIAVVVVRIVVAVAVAAAVALAVAVAVAVVVGWAGAGYNRIEATTTNSISLAKFPTHVECDMKAAMAGVV